MSEIIERVARAICAKIYAEFPEMYWGDPANISTSVDADWSEFADTARDAIAAMREPTEAMILATGREASDAYEATVWKTMIDEASR